MKYGPTIETHEVIIERLLKSLPTILTLRKVRRFKFCLRYIRINHHVVRPEGTVVSLDTEVKTLTTWTYVV